jgi:hypothetical protein
MEQEKTHYRKAFNSPYLSSADIVEPTVLTIKNVVLSGDKTKKTKDVFNTAHFVERELRKGEPLKPMILNAHNSKILKDMSGSPFIDDWLNIPVTIYVDYNVRFGRDTVEGLRISTERPVLKKPELTPSDSEKWSRAVQSYKKYNSLEKVLAVMNISQENIDLIISQAKEDV